MSTEVEEIVEQPIEDSVEGLQLVEEPENEAKTAEMSALQENIHRKSELSYYYAHSHKIDEDAPTWDGL